ncbi:MAG: ABC transporter permease [Candidatus Hydrogenedentota bacterium]
MKAYLIRRFLLIIPTLIGISLLTFLLIQLAPGSPVMARLQGVEGAMANDATSQEIIEQTKKLYGLDKPIYMQYVLWLARMVTLDFGESYEDQRPVLEKIGDALPITLQINFASLFLIYLFSIPLGVYSATHPHSLLDRALTVKLFLLFSIPSFWMAMLLMLFFGGGQYWDVFPVHGVNSTGAAALPWHQWLLDRVWHLLLPTFCLTYASLAIVSRYMRTGMLDVLRQDYIRTARAYGFSERRVIWKYAMRNSLIPIITLLGGLLPTLIGGSVIIEQIFSIPGMGRLAFEAVLFRDYPVIMGTVTMSALLTLAGLILSDLLYVLVDPRIQLK